MKKVAIIGAFCSSKGVFDGQTVKTNILTEEIERACGKENVTRINTYGWRKNPARLFVNCISAVLTHDNVMFVTDEGGIKVFPWLLSLANVTGKCKIHYYVVGGWLGGYLERSELTARKLRTLDAIYVELPAMQRELESNGFSNVVLVNKFRRMTPVEAAQIAGRPEEPYRLCFFSRVMKEKGIEDAVAAVNLANERAGRVKFSLDIYGAVHPPYQDVFDEMVQGFPEYIHYCGMVDFQKSSSVLKDYFTMLFPTFYTSEGYPNAVVDAFFAGLPVVATRWNYNADIIRDHLDGILVDVGSVEQLAGAIEVMASNLQDHFAMRMNCLSRCAEYLPEKAVAKVVAQLK